jgi:hypothetical protein
LVLEEIIDERTAIEELRIIAEERNWFDSPLQEYGLKLFGKE